MPTVTETLHVSGIRCERCVSRLAVALQGVEGLDSANANLVGDVTLSWNADRTSRDEILAVLSRAGFREAAPSGE
ncbi:MAG: cation transporter [Actinobacteria bacterium]|nr:cation transporter [Actinomycetota bacterium]